MRREVINSASQPAGFSIGITHKIFVIQILVPDFIIFTNQVHARARDTEGSDKCLSNALTPDHPPLLIASQLPEKGGLHSYADVETQ